MDGQLLDIYSEFYLEEGKRNTYHKLIGYHKSYDGVNDNNKAMRLYVPLEFWFCRNIGSSLPLVSMQYHEVEINFKLRPLKNLLVSDQIIPSENITDPTTELLVDYIFLDKDERNWFAETEQQYLVQQVFENDYFNVVGTISTEINSRDLVPSYMWRFRRNDAYMRNEWSNFTNWAYNNVLPTQPDNTSNVIDSSGTRYPSPSPNIFIYTTLKPQNKKKIMQNMALMIDGEYREKALPAVFYEYAEKWLRTTGNARDGIYCYNFCIDSNFREYFVSVDQLVLKIGEKIVLCSINFISFWSGNLMRLFFI
jgi:hypothetical protein